MGSTDATSGRLTFIQFQRALQDDGEPTMGAGVPLVSKDQAGAIISNNSGAPEPASPPKVAHAATDINQDPFIKAQVLLERAAAANKGGAFSGNPVVKTNHASTGNPLVVSHGRRDDFGRQVPEKGMSDAYDEREMASTATRMYVGGELSCIDYEGCLSKLGLQVSADSELRRLIQSYEKVGEGNFSQFMRAVNRE